MITVLYIIIGIVILVGVLAIIAPKKQHVFRTIIINKPVTEVFDYVRYFKNQDNWSPWAEKDPKMNKEIVGTDGQVGCVSKWNGNKDVGEGEQEYIEMKENELIRSELRFIKPFESTSNSYLKFIDSEGKTSIEWGLHSEYKFPTSIFMLFMNMEKMLGGDFENGLNKLKGILEK